MHELSLSHDTNGGGGIAFIKKQYRFNILCNISLTLNVNDFVYPPLMRVRSGCPLHVQTCTPRKRNMEKQHGLPGAFDPKINVMTNFFSLGFQAQEANYSQEVMLLTRR